MLELIASISYLKFCIGCTKNFKRVWNKVEIWSVTSFNELYKDGIETERNERYFNSLQSHMFQVFLLIPFLL